VLLGGAIALVAILRRRPAVALGAVALIALSVGTSELLKHVLLPRPRLHLSSVLPQPSFPSGHATVAMALALAAVLVASPRSRGVVAALGLVYALAVGVAVVSAGWHRPSDVLGAQLITFAWAAVVCAVLLRRPRPPRPAGVEPPAPERRAGAGASMLLAGSAGLIALAMLVAAAVVLERRRSGFERFGPGWDFALGAVVIVGVGTALVALLLFLLRGLELEETGEEGRGAASGPGAPPRGSRSASPAG
jgi:hypothetical protein